MYVFGYMKSVYYVYMDFAVAVVVFRYDRVNPVLHTFEFSSSQSIYGLMMFFRGKVKNE